MNHGKHSFHIARETNMLEKELQSEDMECVGRLLVKNLDF